MTFIIHKESDFPKDIDIGVDALFRNSIENNYTNYEEVYSFTENTNENFIQLGWQQITDNLPQNTKEIIVSNSGLFHCINHVNISLQNGKLLNEIYSITVKNHFFFSKEVFADIESDKGLVAIYSDINYDYDPNNTVEEDRNKSTVINTEPPTENKFATLRGVYGDKPALCIRKSITCRNSCKIRRSANFYSLTIVVTMIRS